MNALNRDPPPRPRRRIRFSGPSYGTPQHIEFRPNIEVNPIGSPYSAQLWNIENVLADLGENNV